MKQLALVMILICIDLNQFVLSAFAITMELIAYVMEKDAIVIAY